MDAPHPADDSIFSQPRCRALGEVGEMATLRTRLAAALTGRGGLALIGGEAGSSKIALAAAMRVSGIEQRSEPKSGSVATLAAACRSHPCPASTVPRP